ncbi:MAG TPA: permease prefix domain 1-containing protein [Terriglobales bacterium]|nr:permease prefix domain 1-containing protein [Terriglobales bacterium]
MPERMKPDWTELVRQRLALSCTNDVVSELASHLEETYADACARGTTDTEAIRIALEQVGDWQALAGEIARTRSEEESMNDGTMNHRTKTVLLPAIAVLFGVGLMLLFVDRAAILPRVVWFACIALLLRAAASEANRLNPRTKSLWLPGFVSLTAASLLMFAEEFVLVHDPSFYFNDISLRPSHLISGLPRWFYIVWLVVQVPCGALGAFLSRRNGGTRVARIVAGAFPALTMFFLCGLLIPISAFFEHNGFALSHPSGLALGVLIWAAVPAVALLLGAAPFLKESTLQSA